MKGKKIIKVVLNVIIWIVIILAACMTLITFTSREKGVSEIFGYVPLEIQSESMEPNIKNGDLIFTKSYDGKSDLKEDTVIAFFAMEDNTKAVKVQRIKSVNTVNGMTSYTVQSEKNTDEEPQLVAPGDIISIYNGTKIPVLGSVFTFLKTKVGFFTCIILPLDAFFIYQFCEFIMLLLDYKKTK